MPLPVEGGPAPAEMKRRISLGSLGSTASQEEEKDSKESEDDGKFDSDEVKAKKAAKAAKKLKQQQSGFRARLKRFLKRVGHLTAWTVTHGWNTLTCHYRGRRKNYRLNRKWVQMPDRSVRTMIILNKREAICESKVLAWQDLAKRKRTLKNIFYLYYKSWKQSYDNVRDDTVQNIWERLQMVHKKSGLPRAVLEWWRWNEFIHEGPHGMVFRGTDFHGRTVCIKVRDKSRGNMLQMPLRRAAHTVRRECVAGHIEILRLARTCLAHCGIVRPHFHHQHIAQIYAVFDNAEFYVEVAEWLPGGNLKEYIHNIQSEGHMDEYAICRTFSQLLVAVQYLHSRRLLHRDIRMTQVCLPEEDEDGNAQIELARLCEGWCVMKFSKRTKGSVHDEPLAGDMATRAPEAISHNEWSTKSDIWSAGCILFELLFGHLPFGGEKEALIERVVKKDPEFDKICAHVSASGVDLLRQLLARLPANRPSARAAMDHEWFHMFGGERPKSYARTEERRITEVRLDGKMPECRRGMEPSNLLSAKVGMFNAGFCTFMGSTRTEIDFLIGSEGGSEKSQSRYCVTSVLISLWANADNPKTITVFAANRPNSSWAQIETFTVAGEGVTEARIKCGRPIRYLRISMNGNFGGVFGIAVRKLGFYGYLMKALPVVLNLDKAVYARGAAPCTHHDQMRSEDVKNFPVELKPYLEKGLRIPGTGSRYSVYRDVDSGPAHMMSVMAMHVGHLAKNLTITAAALQLRYVSVYFGSVIPPKVRVTVDQGAAGGRTTLFETGDLKASPHPAEDIVTKGYEDSGVMYADHLNIGTDEGFYLEINFENNGGHIHIPVDLGLVLFYIPEQTTPESSDTEFSDEKPKKKIEDVDKKKDKAAVDEDDEGPDMGKDDDAMSDHFASEMYEKELEADIDEMREYTKYGAWGAGNPLKRESDPFDPVCLPDDDVDLEARLQRLRDRQGIWWEDSEPDSWGSDGEGEAPKVVQPKVNVNPAITASIALAATIHQKAESARGPGGHEASSARRGSARKSTHGGGKKLSARAIKKEAQELREAKERAELEERREEDEFSEAYSDAGDKDDIAEKEDYQLEPDVMNLEMLLRKIPEDLTEAESLFIEEEYVRREIARVETTKIADKAAKNLEMNYKMKRRAEADAKLEADYQHIVNIRPDLLEDLDEDELRRDIKDKRYEFKYVAGGTKILVQNEENVGIFSQLGCSEVPACAAVKQASPCCEAADRTLGEAANCMVQVFPFTPPAPPTSPRSPSTRVSTVIAHRGETMSPRNNNPTSPPMSARVSKFAPPSGSPRASVRKALERVEAAEAEAAAILPAACVVS